MSTFISEFLVLLGTFTRHKAFAIVATTGIILAALYILLVYQRTMQGVVIDKVRGFGDLNVRELLAVGPLIALIIALGIYPKPLTDMINPAVRATMSDVHKSDPVPVDARIGGVK
jgi:NADH-quinone oxidoreductase subunit M